MDLARARAAGSASAGAVVEELADGALIVELPFAGSRLAGARGPARRPATRRCSSPRTPRAAVLASAKRLAGRFPPVEASRRSRKSARPAKEPDGPAARPAPPSDRFPADSARGSVMAAWSPAWQNRGDAFVPARGPSAAHRRRPARRLRALVPALPATAAARPPAACGCAASRRRSTCVRDRYGVPHIRARGAARPRLRASASATARTGSGSSSSSAARRPGGCREFAGPGHAATSTG